MPKKNLHNLFFGFQASTSKSLDLEDQLEAAKKEIESLTVEILATPELHETLTSTGVVYDGHPGTLIFKKLKTAKGVYYLDIDDYVAPINAFMLDTDLEAPL